MSDGYNMFLQPNFKDTKEMINEQEGIKDYIEIAKKMISKFTSCYYRSLSNDMLSNEDVISDVACAIMMADWKFDKDRIGKKGGKKDIYSYRNQCGLWAIKTYVTKRYKNSKKLSSYISSLENNKKHKESDNPIDIIIKKEDSEIKKNGIREILSSDMLSEKQKKHVYMYYIEKKTLSVIGSEVNLTREAIRQSISKALVKIKKYSL